jgi:hypothetical protein
VRVVAARRFMAIRRRAAPPQWPRARSRSGRRRLPGTSPSDHRSSLARTRARGAQAIQTPSPSPPAAEHLAALSLARAELQPLRSSRRRTGSTEAKGHTFALRRRGYGSVLAGGVVGAHVRGRGEPQHGARGHAAGRQSVASTAAGMKQKRGNSVGDRLHVK